MPVRIRRLQPSLSPFCAFLGRALALLLALLELGQEAPGLTGHLFRGVVLPQLPGQEHPARAVYGQGLELGKGLAARGGVRDEAPIQARPLGDPRALHECQGFQDVQGDHDRRARIPQQAGEVRRAEQGTLVTGQEEEYIPLAACDHAQRVQPTGNLRVRRQVRCHSAPFCGGGRPPCPPAATYHLLAVWPAALP
jgi:hypothetical protein